MPKKKQDQDIAQPDTVSVEEQRKAFLLTVPMRLLDAQALAIELGISTNVRSSATGTEVSFYDSTSLVDYKMGYDCEKWKLVELESDLFALKDARDYRELRRTAAMDAWAKISPQDQPLIKEFINILKVSK
jgi:hypothetical protein